MKKETANALCRYFEVLHNLNQNLIIMCGDGIFEHQEEQSRRIDEIIMSIPRLIPYFYNIKKSKYEIKDNDGLLSFSEDLPFLKNDYKTILQKHYEFLQKAKKVRDKLEHKMHGAKIVASSSGSTSMFSITYEIVDFQGDTVEFDLNAQEAIKFTKDINLLFSKIQKLFEEFGYKNKLTDYPYFWRINRCDFTNFNKIYESNLLHIFGKAMLPF